MYVEKEILYSGVATDGPIGVPQPLHLMACLFNLFSSSHNISVKVLHGDVALCACT